MVGLPVDAGAKFPAQLSGGMIKRAALARALALDPVLLFLDEPTAGLDPIAAAAFDDLVLYLRRTLGLTVVMVTHDLDTLARTCDRVAVLVDRKVIVDTLHGIVRNDHPWIREYFHGARGRVIAPTATEATAVERDAKYATVALFALACIAAAVAFVWWYSGRGDRRDYADLRNLFRGHRQRPVQGQPRALPGRRRRPRHRASASTSAMPAASRSSPTSTRRAPISGATLAKLGLLGLTGLLYIDLQQDPGHRRHDGPCSSGAQYPVIPSRKGSDRGLGRAAAGDPGPGHGSAGAHRARAVRRERARRSARRSPTSSARRRPAGDAWPTRARWRPTCAASRQSTLAADEARSTRRSSGRSRTCEATLANARIASEKLARTADGLDRLLNANEAASARNAGASVAELQQLVIDARSASNEVRELARTLRERPSSVLFEPKAAGVEIPR